MKKTVGLSHVKICPRCKSTEISLWLGATLGIQYQCKKCGYIGPVVIEELSK